VCLCRTLLLAGLYNCLHLKRIALGNVVAHEFNASVIHHPKEGLRDPSARSGRQTRAERGVVAVLRRARLEARNIGPEARKRR
jgi:hypothetical protein